MVTKSTRRPPLSAFDMNSDSQVLVGLIVAGDPQPQARRLQLRPQLDGLVHRHVGLGLEVRFIEAQQVFGFGLRQLALDLPRASCSSSRLVFLTMGTKGTPGLLEYEASHR